MTAFLTPQGKPHPSDGRWDGGGEGREKGGRENWGWYVIWKQFK